jgi:hypothetical protein
VQTSLLIDSIVRQITVLIAQLSTTSGLRAPLAHVADQVFLDLVTELEGQGVGRKVIADMFGLALRSYQQKVQRLQGSATERGVTLWEAMLSYIQSHETASRAEVLARFARDDSATVRGVLNDLVGSGLVYRTGNADATVYRAARANEVENALEPAARVAVHDHFQAVVGALCAELARASGPPNAPPSGGSHTFTFDVGPDHPQYQQVTGLLEQHRAQLAKLWDRVQAHNTQHGKPASHERVTFYFGQNVRSR